MDFLYRADAAFTIVYYASLLPTAHRNLRLYILLNVSKCCVDTKLATCYNTANVKVRLASRISKPVIPNLGTTCVNLTASITRYIPHSAAHFSPPSPLQNLSQPWTATRPSPILIMKLHFRIVNISSTSTTLRLSNAHFDGQNGCTT